MNSPNLSETPAGLYGSLATESELNTYVKNVRKKETNTIARDDAEGTVSVHSGKGTLMFRAIRKGAPGQPWLLMLNPVFYPKPQLFREGSAVVRRHPETREQFAIINGGQAIPFEICGIAAGRDAWMRQIVFKCVECKGDVEAGKAECNLCPACYERAGEENARADGHA